MPLEKHGKSADLCQGRSLSPYVMLDPDGDPDGDPDHPCSLIICSMHHCCTVLKISSKSICNFLCKIAIKQTDKQTTIDKKLASLADRTIT